LNELRQSLKRGFLLLILPLELVLHLRIRREILSLSTARPGSFMLAHEKPNTSTPESHSQGTPYKSTDLSVVLEPLDADPNSPGITTQSVKSPKSSPVGNRRLLSESRVQILVYSICSTIPLFWIPERPVMFAMTNQGLQTSDYPRTMI
jgi:hypothetical protein